MAEILILFFFSPIINSSFIKSRSDDPSDDAARSEKNFSRWRQRLEKKVLETKKEIIETR